MPKVSKVSVPKKDTDKAPASKSKKTAAAAAEDITRAAEEMAPVTEPAVPTPPAAPPAREYYCVRCGKKFKSQQNNFPSLRTGLYRTGNGGYSPFCYYCLDEMYGQYKRDMGDDMAAMRRMCMLLDAYWNPDIYYMAYTSKTSVSRFRDYLKRANVYKYTDKSFDDTLMEEKERESERASSSIHVLAAQAELAGSGEEEEDGSYEIDPKDIEFWGPDLTIDMYATLNARFSYWAKLFPDMSKIDITTQAILRQVCIAEMQINKKVRNGEDTTKDQAALNTLLGSANLKPVQQRDTGGDSDLEQRPFGCWIERIEKTEPIPECDPAFEDVDHIRRYMSVWVFGHLCKLLKIQNKYSKAYDDEMARLTVERPEYEGAEEDEIYEDIFARAEAEDTADAQDDTGGGDDG